jgi:hypothetical protein
MFFKYLKLLEKLEVMSQKNWSGRQMVHLGKEINELDKNVRAFNLTLILLISSVLTKLGDSG